MMPAPAGSGLNLGAKNGKVVPPNFLQARMHHGQSYDSGL